jgi:hypothetical protein
MPVCDRTEEAVETAGYSAANVSRLGFAAFLGKIRQAVASGLMVNSSLHGRVGLGRRTSRRMATEQA